MEVKQIYDVVNKAVAKTIGDSAIIQEDLGCFHFQAN